MGFGIDKKNETTWLDEEIEFYDFIWKYGTKTCACCLNDQLTKDFLEGGTQFEAMKKKIFKKFPMRELAIKAFKKASAANERDDSAVPEQEGDAT